MAVNLRYRLPSLRYREIDARYRGFTAGGDGGQVGLSQPRRPSVLIKFFDVNDTLQGIVSTNTGRANLLSGRFELVDTGCGSFELVFARQPVGTPVQHDWRVEIYLWNDYLPWYSGVVQTKPGDGTTERTYRYTGFGFFGFVDRVLIFETFPAGTKPSAMADKLFRTLETETGGRLVYSSSLVQNTNYVTSGEVKFVHVPFKTAMKQICELAGGFEYGIDEQRRPWFKAPSTTVVDDSRWWAGKHMETYVPEEDSSKIANVIVVKLGKVRTDLPNTSPLFKTNFLEDPLEDADSQAAYGKRKAIYTAPSLYDVTDSVRGASVELARKKDPIQRARIRNIDFTGVKVTASGLARVTGIGGASWTLPKKRVTYRLGPNRIALDVELGDYDPTPGAVLATITQNAANEALARQQSQSQL